MEAYLLLAKVHYFSSSFAHALEDLEKSQLDAAKTQFITLRSLKLAAEGYAIKGFATERLMADEQKSHEVSKKRLLSFFESAVELTISYINEFEKSVAGAPSECAFFFLLFGPRACRKALNPTFGHLF